MIPRFGRDFKSPGWPSQTCLSHQLYPEWQ